MKRMKVLFGNRRMMVMLTLAILVLAAAALIASSASFTAQSANVRNTFTTGNLDLSGETVTFTGKLWPGDYLDGTSGVNVTADGGNAQLWLKVVGYSTPSVADVLTLEVLDSTGLISLAGPYDVTGAEFADGVFIEGGLVNGATPSYTFRVNFPDGDTPPALTLADKGADNPYMNTTADVDFQWVAVSE